MNRRNLSVLATTAFASAPAAGAAPAAAKPASGKRGAPSAADRKPLEFTEVSTDWVPPAKIKRNALAIELDKLAVGASIGLIGKTKKQISPAVSKLNADKANQRNVIDPATGNPVTVNGDPIKDANGAPIGYQQVVKTERIKEFDVHDVDPKTDPKGASVRVIRVK